MASSLKLVASPKRKASPKLKHKELKLLLPDMSKIKTTHKVRVKSCDMAQSMAKAAIELADKVMLTDADEAVIARRIKHAFDDLYPPPWHCIVGRKFSSMLTQEHGYFVYFFMGHKAVLLFKSKD